MRKILLFILGFLIILLLAAFLLYQVGCPGYFRISISPEADAPFWQAYREEILGSLRLFTYIAIDAFCPATIFVN